MPSKVLLDKPYPENLPVVDVCEDCNNGFSEDEAYLACLIECAIQGTTNPNKIERQKISRILLEQQSLRSRINQSKIEDDEDNIFWKVETERFEKIITKLARGHLNYHLSFLQFDEPTYIETLPLAEMSEEVFNDFNFSENNGLPEILPEIGTRDFLLTFMSLKKKQIYNYQDWHVVQNGRYRYRITQDNGNIVQIVLSEYLACTVVWN